MNKDLAYRTIAYLKTHYTTNDETIINKEEIEAIDFILDELDQLTNNWNELEKDINNQLMMTRKFDDYNEGFFDATLHYYNKMKEIKEKK